MERIIINSKEELTSWTQERRRHDYDFEPDFYHYEFHNKFPLMIFYVDTESNGYPDVEYDIFYPVPKCE